MEDEVTFLPSSSREDPPSPERSPLVDASPPIERETNTMTQGELDHFRESYYFLSNIQIRLLEVDDTIVSTRSGKVASYEAAFYAGLRLPIDPIIRSTTSAPPSSFPMRGEVSSVQ